MTTTQEAVSGVEHRAIKRHASGPISLYVWEKFLPSREKSFTGTVLLIHGSSMASRPSFDLSVPGHEGEYSLMDYLARQGFVAREPAAYSFRDEFLEEFRESGRVFKGPLGPAKTIYHMYFGNKARFSKSIEEQALAKQLPLP